MSCTAPSREVGRDLIGALAGVSRAVRAAHSAGTTRRRPCHFALSHARAGRAALPLRLRPGTFHLSLVQSPRLSALWSGRRVSVARPATHPAAARALLPGDVHRAGRTPRTHPRRDEALVWCLVERKRRGIARPRRRFQTSRRGTRAHGHAANVDPRPALPSARPSARARRRADARRPPLGARAPRRVPRPAGEAGRPVQGPAESMVETGATRVVPTGARQGVVAEMGRGRAAGGRRRSGAEISGELLVPAAAARAPVGTR